MTDHLTENARLRAALLAWEAAFLTGRNEPLQIAYENGRNALATPAPDAVQEAARVPEIAALIEAASALGVRDMVAGWNGEGREHPYTPHPASLWAKINTTCGAVYALDAALRAIAGDRTAKEAGQ